MTVNEKREYKAADWAALLILAVAAALLVWRCLYSFCASDESFYLAMTHRFWLGQLPVVEEWNSAQLYAILLLPFYGAWRALTGSVDGVYLAARIVYVLLAAGTAFAVYLQLRAQNRAAALSGGLLVLFYVKANIGGLSYYGICFVCVVLALTLLYGWKPGRGGAVRAFCAGVLFAIAVVCMPFLAVCSLAVLPFLFVPRLRRWRGAGWWVVAGILAAAVVYCIALFSRITPMQLLENVPYVLDDPDNHELNLLYLLARYFGNPVYQFIYTAPLWGGAGLFTLYRMLRKKPLSEKQRFWVLMVAAAALLGNLLLSVEIPGKAHTALCIFAAQCWLLTPKEKLPWKAAGFFFVPGLIFALVWQMSSNTQFSGMTVGFALSAVGAALMVPPCLEEMKPSLPRWVVPAVLCLALAGPVLVSGWQRLALVYRDAPLLQCTARLEQGPGAGLYTTPAHKQQYEDVRSTIVGLGNEEKPIFISSLLPWGYLCTDRPVGAPNTWRTLVDGKQLMDYYEVNPGNFPADVLVLAPEIGDYISTIQPEENPAPNLNAEDSDLLRLLAQKGYTVRETAAGTVYTAP